MKNEILPHLIWQMQITLNWYVNSFGLFYSGKSFRGHRQKIFEFFIGIGLIDLKPPPPLLLSTKIFQDKVWNHNFLFDSIRHFFVDLAFRRLSLLMRLSFDYLTHIEFVYNTRVDVEN